MGYEIYCNGTLIATFKNESDRDVALDALQLAFEDVTFTTI